MTHDSYSGLDITHIALALAIAAAYVTVPFTALRRLPVPRIVQVSGMVFFLTCALTHLALAAGFHDSPWMVLSDLVQFIAVVTFIATLSRMVEMVMNRQRRLAALEAEGGQPPGPAHDEPEGEDLP